MTTSSISSYVNASSIQRKPSSARAVDRLRTSVAPAVKPSRNELRQVLLQTKVAETFKKASGMALDAIVDSLFKFSYQEYAPTQKNFAPVEEIGDAVLVECEEGKIPAGFPEGIFVRNGGNPLFGALQSVVSPFGTTRETWAEGEGMLHALFFEKGDDSGWSVLYRNKFVESRTYKDELKRNKPTFLPAIHGNPAAMLVSFFLNRARHGTLNKHLSNASIFSHGGKLYAISENYIPVEINSRTLETIGEWQVLSTAAWGRPCTSHPKRAPGSGELVLMGITAAKPFLVVGILSADGKQLLHKADVNLSRGIISHDLGVTERYNILIDHPLTLSIERIYRGGKLIKHEKDGYARIGVMPRYGDAISISWFDVEPNCTLHILNCFEDGDEVVIRGCRARDSILDGPDVGEDSFEWYSRGFKHIHATRDGDADQSYLFHRVYEWRLNMVTQQVKEGYVSGTDVSMDYPFINDNFVGLKNKYGYTQVVNSEASSEAGVAKYSGLAKLCFDEPPSGGRCDSTIKMEYHDIGENCFCSGSVFVPREGGNEEDDGWVIAFVHSEETDVSQVHVIDAKSFEGKPVAKIRLPQRVPYGFHATFMKKHSPVVV
ncbi:hypothetical protein MLD38_007041 [Melastoma candidum]|uniref:Uncharacterized protein n=1 Tax=Melastoma candidum TaxID=119954 RepID=A0ACB9RPS8_9MYRT|nr:hypothetical protein MLD38_007041 [Melastoma candidum]